MALNILKVGLLLAAMTAILVTMGALIGGQQGMSIAFAIALAINLFSFWNSDKIVLRMHGARQVDAQSAPQYYKTVAALARRAELPMPSVYIMHSAQPNAFATGRSPRHSAVCASTGLLEMLDADEVAGVMAHELAHIKNRDTLIMTIAATIAGAISMLANVLQFSLLFGGGRAGESRNATGIIGMLVAIFLAPIAAMLIQMAISRSREYVADRIGGEICGNPLWLASALQKISGAAREIPMESAERIPASAHLFIVNPLLGSTIDNLFSTHPKAGNRIDALVQQARDMNIQPGDPNHPNSAMERRQPAASGSRASPWKPRRGPWG